MAVNWKGAGMGALGGAGSGALAGTMVAPGIGTGIGALLGLFGGGLGGLFGGGNEGGFERMQLSPEEQSIFKFLMQQGQQGLQNPYQGFDPIKQQAISGFNQQVVPGLAERFTSMGQNNIASSPAFATHLGYAGAGLQQGLAALQSQYGQQNQQNALRQLQFGLTPALSQNYRQSQPGVGEGILSSLFQSGPEMLSQYHQGTKMDAMTKALEALNPAAKG